MRESSAARRLLLIATMVLAAGGEGPAAARAAGPPLLTRPAAAGRPYTGELVTLTPARWRTPADLVERAWIRCIATSSGGCRPHDIAGETATTYVITAADVGATVYAGERAHDASGWSDWVTSNSPGDDAMPQGISPWVTAGPGPLLLVPDWTTLPAVTGVWRVGSRLTASPGIWSPPADAFEYRWERCRGGDDGQDCEVVGIAGATSRTYVLVSDDAGTWPQVKVRAYNANGWSPWAESLLERWDPVGERQAGGAPDAGGGGSGDSGAPGTPGALAIRGLTLSPTRLRAAASGATFGPGHGGARVKVLVSARPASLVFRVERLTSTRWVARGGPVRVRPPASAARVVRLRFSGRVAGRRLAAGSYRLRAVAVDGAGNTSAARTARFRIVR